MKKIILTLFTLLLISDGTFALSIEEILSSASSESFTVRNAELTYAYNQLLLAQNSLDDKPEWSLSLSLSPLDSSLDAAIVEISALQASVTLADDGDTTITVSSPMDIGYEGAFYIRPRVEVSHKFDFNYFDDDKIRDVDNAISRLSTERVYKEALYSFYKSVISQVSALLSLEMNIKSLEHDIKRAETDLNNMLLLRNADEESISYQRALLELSMDRRSLDIYADQYEKAKSQFKILTGLEWTGLDDFDLPEISFTPYEGGNSEILELSLESNLASLRSEQKDKAMNPRALTLSSGAGGTYMNDDYRNSSGLSYLSEYSIDLDISAALAVENWTLGASFELSKEKNESFMPSLTLSASWKSNTSRESDRIELEMLRNAAIRAQNDYLDGLTEYNIEAMTLQNEIMDQMFSLETVKQREEYLYQYYLSENQYYERGLVRFEDVEDALHEYELAHIERLIEHLDSLLLYYDVLIYSL